MNRQHNSTIDRVPPMSSALRTPARGVIAAIGGLFGAVAASSCCILPLVLFTLGISGAWIGDLTALEPYQPIFIVVTLGFLAAGYYGILRKPSIGCAEGGRACVRLLPSWIMKSALWAATALVLAAIVFPYVAAALLGT